MCILLRQWLLNSSQEAEIPNTLLLKMEYELLEYLMILHELKSMLLKETISLILAYNKKILNTNIYAHDNILTIQSDTITF